MNDLIGVADSIAEPAPPLCATCADYGGRSRVESGDTGCGPADAPAEAPTPGGGARAADCLPHEIKDKLQQAGLRPTRQRVALGSLLFGAGDRHLTAEMLYEEASRGDVPLSLATVYNTLHQFTAVGLLRQVSTDGAKTYFDTNSSEHNHFFVEDQNELIDIPSAQIEFGAPPVLPEGFEIVRIDLIVRLRRVRPRKV